MRERLVERLELVISALKNIECSADLKKYHELLCKDIEDAIQIVKPSELPPPEFRRFYVSFSYGDGGHGYTTVKLPPHQKIRNMDDINMIVGKIRKIYEDMGEPLPEDSFIIPYTFFPLEP